jgi:hypothetical protein
MKWFKPRRNVEVKHLFAEQVEICRRYACFDIGLDEMLQSLAGVFEFNFQPNRRTANTNFIIPEPSVLIARKHIKDALERHRASLISSLELMKWATVILLNDAYDISEEDQDFIAESLNELSTNPDAISVLQSKI